MEHWILAVFGIDYCIAVNNKQNNCNQQMKKKIIIFFKKMINQWNWKWYTAASFEVQICNWRKKLWTHIFFCWNHNNVFEYHGVVTLRKSNEASQWHDIVWHHMTSYLNAKPLKFRNHMFYSHFHSQKCNHCVMQKHTVNIYHTPTLINPIGCDKPCSYDDKARKRNIHISIACLFTCFHCGCFGEHDFLINSPAFVEFNFEKNGKILKISRLFWMPF